MGLKKYVSESTDDTKTHMMGISKGNIWHILFWLILTQTQNPYMLLKNPPAKTAGLYETL